VFANVLNKGIRSGLAIVLSFFLIFLILSLFSSLAIDINDYPNLFYNYFTNSLKSKIAIVVINYVFVLLGSFLVYVITINQEIADKANFFPVFIYMALSSVSVNAFQITPQAFTNIFILFSVYKLLDTYRKENVLTQLFEAAFWLSLSAFITISSVISFPLFFIILLLLRPFYWRDWIISLLGFIAPIFIFECIAYLSNFNQWYFISATSLYIKALKIPSFSEYYLALSAFLFILLVFAILNSLAKGFGNTVKKQRAKYILLWILFFSSFGFFSGGANSSSIILTYAFPLSFFIGDFLFQLKDIKITNTLLTVFLLCIALVFLAQYQII
jgi:hypothetical protein